MTPYHFPPNVLRLPATGPRTLLLCGPDLGGTARLLRQALTAPTRPHPVGYGTASGLVVPLHTTN